MENIVEKGEIAHFEQFHLFHNVFQKFFSKSFFLQRVKNKYIWRKGLINSLPHNPDFLTTQGKKLFENTLGKGENAGNQHFLLFPQCFLPFHKTNPIISATPNLSSALALNLAIPKIVLFGRVKLK